MQLGLIGIALISHTTLASDRRRASFFEEIVSHLSHVFESLNGDEPVRRGCLREAFSRIYVLITAADSVPDRDCAIGKLIWVQRMLLHWITLMVECHVTENSFILLSLFLLIFV